MFLNHPNAVGLHGSDRKSTRYPRYSVSPRQAGTLVKRLKANKDKPKETKVGRGAEAFEQVRPFPSSSTLTDAVHRAKIPKTVFTVLSSIYVVSDLSHKDFSLATLPMERVCGFFVGGVQGRTETGRNV